MRTITRGLALAAALAALGACHSAKQPQPARDPIGGEPRTQAAQDPIGGDPSPQKSRDPVASLIGEEEVYGTQTPASDPKPQQSTFADPQPQKSGVPLFGGDSEVSAKAQSLSDGEVLAVTQAANQASIDVAEVARKQAQSAEVKQLAATLVTHHRDAKAKDQRVQSKAKVDVRETELSKQVKEEARADLDTLKGKKGREFDKAFLDGQIESHRDLLAKIDDTLAPNAESPEVKAHLAEMRKSTSTHLSKAEEIRRKMGDGTAPDTAKGKTTAPKKGDVDR